jgi:putative transposase
MKRLGIGAKQPQSYRITTDSNHAYRPADNLLNREFQASKPNQKWAGDISYLTCSDGTLYLAVIL